MGNSAWVNDLDLEVAVGGADLQGQRVRGRALAHRRRRRSAQQRRERLPARRHRRPPVGHGPRDDAGGRRRARHRRLDRPGLRARRLERRRAAGAGPCWCTRRRRSTTARPAATPTDGSSPTSRSGWSSRSATPAPIRPRRCRARFGGGRRPGGQPGRLRLSGPERGRRRARTRRPTPGTWRTPPRAAPTCRPSSRWRARRARRRSRSRSRPADRAPSRPTCAAGAGRDPRRRRGRRRLLGVRREPRTHQGPRRDDPGDRPRLGRRPDDRAHRTRRHHGPPRRPPRRRRQRRRQLRRHGLRRRGGTEHLPGKRPLYGQLPAPGRPALALRRQEQARHLDAARARPVRGRRRHAAELGRDEPEGALRHRHDAARHVDHRLPVKSDQLQVGPVHVRLERPRGDASSAGSTAPRSRPAAPPPRSVGSAWAPTASAPARSTAPTTRTRRPPPTPGPSPRAAPPPRRRPRRLPRPSRSSPRRSASATPSRAGSPCWPPAQRAAGRAPG